MILWILAISAVVWCDDQPKVDPTTRIQKHEIGKAVIYDRMETVMMVFSFENIFKKKDPKLAWNSVYDDCKTAGILHGEDNSTSRSLPVDQRSLEIVFEFKKIFYHPQVSPSGLLEKVLKQMWNLTYDQEEYSHHLQPFVTLKPVHCFSSNKTVVLTITYPIVTHLGHIMETWDAGDSFGDIQKYTYLNMPFHLIKANDSYFTYNKNSCNVTDNFLICQMKDLELLERCHPDNIKDCYRSVFELKGSTYIRQLKYFYLVSSPLNEFTRKSSNSSIKVNITPHTLTYIKLGPNETLVFEDRSDVYDVSDGKPFFMAQFHYNRSSELEKFAHYVEEQLVSGYICTLKNKEYLIDKVFYLIIIVMLLIVICVTKCSKG